MKKRIFLIVLDSFGVGNAPDAANFGDEGSNTLAAIASHPNFHTPHLEQLGLFQIEGTPDKGSCQTSLGAFGRLQEQSLGKDTTKVQFNYYVDGVCERCGLRNEQETDSVFLLEDLRKNEAYAESGKYVVGVCMNQNGGFGGIPVDEASQISVRIVDMSDPDDTGVMLDNSVGWLTEGKFGEIRSSMLYLLDEAAIEAAAQSAGISDFNLNDYGVEVSFAPTWTQESGYVCSITITDYAFGA